MALVDVPVDTCVTFTFVQLVDFTNVMFNVTFNFWRFKPQRTRLTLYAATIRYEKMMMKII